MLILSRKKAESIIIDGNIEVKIIDIQDGKVRLGIEAPEDIEILRNELYIEVEKENKAAVGRKLDLNNMKELLKK